MALADYIAFFWYECKTEEERKRKKLVVIDYYDHAMYVYAYQADSTGKEYYRMLDEPQRVHHGRTDSHLKNDIMELAGIKKDEEICILKTFSENITGKGFDTEKIPVNEFHLSRDIQCRGEVMKKIEQWKLDKVSVLSK